MFCQDCSWLPQPNLFIVTQNVTSPPVQHNPDVAGRGVLAGFMGPAYITLMILISYYFLGFHPDDLHLRAEPERSARVPSGLTPKITNTNLKPAISHEALSTKRIKRLPRGEFDKDEAIDRLVNPIDRVIQKWPRKIPLQRIKWQRTFASIALMLGDTQLLTGIAILGSAFSQLKCGGISTYHWQIALYLAWLASLSHTSMLVPLRDYLRARPLTLGLRVLTMFALTSLLTVALLPTGLGIWLTVNSSSIECIGNATWTGGDLTANSSAPLDGCYVVSDYYPGAEVICYYTSDWMQDLGTSDSSEYFPLMVISVLFLWLSFFTRVVKVIKETSSYLYTISTGIGNWIRGLLFELNPVSPTKSGKYRLLLFLIFWPVVALYAICKAWLDIFGSMLFEIFWLIVALTWGTLRLLETRNSITDSDFEDQSKAEENTLTFGQWISFLLLIVPAYSMVEIWYDAKVQEHDDKKLELQSLIDTAEQIYDSLDDPRNEKYYDRNWYSESWFLGLIFLEFAFVIQFSIVVFITGVYGGAPAWTDLVENLTQWGSKAIPTSLFGYTILFLILQDSLYYFRQSTFVKKWGKICLYVFQSIAILGIIMATSFVFVAYFE